uniref:Uncharacterized protein n=1 Tax=Ditylenchus dipsaci TaxID=166011 RepID=A0A915EHL9_9BILA
MNHEQSKASIGKGLIPSSLLKAKVEINKQITRLPVVIGPIAVESYDLDVSAPATAKTSVEYEKYLNIWVASMRLGLFPYFAFVFFASVMMVVGCGRKKKAAKRPKKYADIDGSPNTGSKKVKKGENTSGNSASCSRTAIPNQPRRRK